MIHAKSSVSRKIDVIYGCDLPPCDLERLLLRCSGVFKENNDVKVMFALVSVFFFWFYFFFKTYDKTKQPRKLEENSHLLTLLPESQGSQIDSIPSTNEAEREREGASKVLITTLWPTCVWLRVCVCVCACEVSSDDDRNLGFGPALSFANQ